MKVFGKLTKNFCSSTLSIGAAGLLFGLAACGEDSTTAPEQDPVNQAPVYSSTGEIYSSGIVGYSSSSINQGSNPGANTGVSSATNPGSSTSTNPGTNPGSNPGTVVKSSSSAANPATQKPVSSSSKKTETASADEKLNDANQAVAGRCGPKSNIVEKGGMATWEFYRESGDVFESIMAPYVWNFPEISRTVQGNGMNTVNVAYPEPGTYTATLNVDGNAIECEPLQVQGIPVVISSCKADKDIAKAGETITWTVEATSEAAIVGYAWSSKDGEASGSSTTGTMLATSDMHKKKVSVTVAVTNDDKTTQTFVCDGVDVLDPESVDMVMVTGDINAYKEVAGLLDVEEDMLIPANSPMTVQVPATANANCNIGCKPRNGSDYNDAKVTWDDELLSNFSYFAAPGCAPGKKYSVTANVTMFCLVIK